MSRFGDNDYDGAGPPPEFWQQAGRNALRGRKGQAVLRELREALLALPAPRLIEGAVCQEGEVCAMGALARYRFFQGRSLQWGTVIFYSLTEMQELLGEALADEWVTVEIGEALGLKQALAWRIAWENDEGCWNSETHEARYQRVLGWVERQLAPAVGVGP